MNPRYQSSVLVQVVVQLLRITRQTTIVCLPATSLVQTEADLATSDPVLREVATHYAGLTAHQLAAEVTSTVKTNTQLFEIDALNSSPQRAADLANDIAKTLIKQQSQQTQQENLQSQQQLQQNLDFTQQQINDTSDENR